VHPLEAATAKGWRWVARHMHNQNFIMDARSAKPFAPNSVAAIGNERPPKLNFFTIAP